MAPLGQLDATDRLDVPCATGVKRVQDIGPGLLVDDAAACEAECDATAQCNAASFTAELHRTGRNCFLRTLGNACELPNNATATLHAILSLNCDPSAISPSSVADAPAESGTGATADTGTGDGDADGVAVAPVDSTSRGVAGDTAAEDGTVVDPNGGSPELSVYRIGAIVALAGVMVSLSYP